MFKGDDLKLKKQIEAPGEVVFRLTHIILISTAGNAKRIKESSGAFSGWVAAITASL